jgi:PKHD-type hydroxylase
MLAIADLCSPAQAQNWATTLQRCAFVDGKTSAGASAALVKKNSQLANNHESQPIIHEIQSAIENHPLLRLYAKPRAFTPVLINRYETNNEYGWHTDNTKIADCRTDLSFTLFLSDPNSYDGGELCVQSHMGESSYKFEAGQMLLYPSNAIHCVKAVTRGVRLAAVGWIESDIADAEIRNWCFDLNVLNRQLRHSDPHSELALKLAHIEGAIARRFSK